MSDLNLNNKDHRNRGVDVLLNSKKQPYLFRIVVKKILNFFKKEFTIYFEFSVKSKRSK